MGGYSLSIDTEIRVNMYSDTVTEVVREFGEQSPLRASIGRQSAILYRY